MLKILSILLGFSVFCNITYGALNQSNLSKLNDWLFVNPEQGVKSEAIVITQNGKTLYEKIKVGTKDTKYILWSMSKSISSLLFGIAESKGLVNREDSIYKYFKEDIDKMGPAKVKELKQIKLKHFLQMSSGLAWNEFYDKDPFNSHVVKMLYFDTLDDVAKVVLKTPKRHAPGDHFHYSSGDTNVFMAVLKKVVGKDLKNNFPWKWFFDPMQMDAIFEQDASGTFLGSSYVYLSTNDLIKLGYLIINKGMYQGKQVVPVEYIQFATSLSESLQNPKRCLKDSYMTYGAQLWLNHPCINGDKPFKGAPDDMVMLLGYGGQSIFIYPSKGIVAARIAKDNYRALDKNKYSELLLGSFK